MAAASAQKSSRVLELDCLRGLALLTITINHYQFFVSQLGYDFVQFQTLTHLGYSSAAELFFLMSGYLVGLLYIPAGRDISMQSVAARLIGRACYLLVMNCFLFVAVLGTAHFWGDETRRLLGLYGAQEDPYNVAFHVLRLGYHIPLLGILNFYVIMMVAAVPFIWVMRRNISLAITLSVLAYIVSQIFPEFSPLGGSLDDPGNGLMAFNPLAWQILFMGAIVAGHLRLHERIAELVSKNIAWVYILALVYLGGVANKTFYILYIPFTGKQELEPMRLAHSVFSLVVLLALLFAIKGYQNNILYRALCLIGKNSLQCFVVGVLLSYAMAVTFGAVFDGQGQYYLVMLCGCLLLLLSACVFQAHALAKKGALRMPSVSLDSRAIIDK